MTWEVMDRRPERAHDESMLTLTRPDTDETDLRRILLTNASTSGAGGAAALLFGGPVDALLGTDNSPWVRVVGAGLVAFALFVALTARATTSRLVAETPWISVGDLAWVGGTVLTIGLGWYSAAGAVVMAIVGAMVGSFGVAQATLVRRVRSRASDD